MSLYNMVFGSQPSAGLVLAILDREAEWMGRFRDAWFERDEHGEVRMAVYTRNGGGNRTHYSFDDENKKEEGASCDCTGCIGKYRIPSHLLYLFDRDDAMDSTYVTFYFKLPAKIPASLEAAIGVETGDKLLAMLKEKVPEGVIDTSKRWQDALDALKGMGEKE